MPDDQLPVLPPDESTGSWLSRNRKSAILGAVVIVLAAVATGLTLWNNFKPVNSSNTTNDVVNTNDDDTGTPVTPTTNRPTFQRYTATVSSDQDHDGLTDEQERQFKTDPKVADSDGDGLTDAEEVSIYLSNPLAVDSDRDGVNDGAEVAHGDNPNGAGVLRDARQQLEQLRK